MSDESWDEQFRQFLRKTGDDFRRTGEDIKAEAQKLLDAAMDPEKQQRVRDRLNELTQWARRTAQGVAGAVEDAASKAENAFYRAADKMTPPAGSAPEAQPVAATKPARKPSAVKKASRAKAKASKPAKKTIGRRKR